MCFLVPNRTCHSDQGEAAWRNLRIWVGDAVKAGCDTFVTSDVKYNQFWDARDLGLNLIDAGHFHTENPVTIFLAEKIAAVFPEIEVKISETHWDCVKFY